MAVLAHLLEPSHVAPRFRFALATIVRGLTTETLRGAAMEIPAAGADSLAWALVRELLAAVPRNQWAATELRDAAAADFRGSCAHLPNSLMSTARTWEPRRDELHVMVEGPHRSCHGTWSRMGRMKQTKMTDPLAESPSEHA